LRSAKEQTRYEIELFDVELLAGAAEKVAAGLLNRWVREDEVRRWCCDDGRRVSETTEKQLSLAGLIEAAPGGA
jgi:hypothetical protein